MPQLDSGGGGAGAGDDLGAPDELLAFQDEEVERDGKSRDGPRELAELKSTLVNESEGAEAGAGSRVPASGCTERPREGPRPWNESTLRRDISRTNFQGP